jgi:putative redox protein
MDDCNKRAEAKIVGGTFYTEVKIGDKTFQADEPVSIGGTDLAPTPMNYLLGALASCTSITIKMYAQRKGWDIGEISVHVTLIEQSTLGGRKIKKTLKIENPLSPEQITRLLLIGNKCPVAKLLENNVEMEFELEE